MKELKGLSSWRYFCQHLSPAMHSVNLCVCACLFVYLFLYVRKYIFMFMSEIIYRYVFVQSVCVCVLCGVLYSNVHSSPFLHCTFSRAILTGVNLSPHIPHICLNKSVSCLSEPGLASHPYNGSRCWICLRHGETYKYLLSRMALSVVWLTWEKKIEGAPSLQVYPWGLTKLFQENRRKSRLHWTLEYR